MTVLDAAPSNQLSDDELRIEREKLEAWCTPQEFHNKVDALAAQFSLEDRFSSPRLAFLRDAILLTEFALKSGATSVRLAAESDQFPDGYVTVQGMANVRVALFRDERLILRVVATTGAGAAERAYGLGH